jgi:hypothetical protein
VSTTGGSGTGPPDGPRGSFASPWDLDSRTRYVTFELVRLSPGDRWRWRPPSEDSRQFSFLELADPGWPPQDLQTSEVWTPDDAYHWLLDTADARSEPAYPVAARRGRRPGHAAYPPVRATHLTGLLLLAVVGSEAALVTHPFAAVGAVPILARPDWEYQLRRMLRVPDAELPAEVPDESKAPSTDPAVLAALDAHGRMVAELGVLDWLLSHGPADRFD